MSEQNPQPQGRKVSEKDLSYLMLLKTLKRAGGAGGGSDLAVVQRIAAWIDSVRVLKYICAEPRWFDDWDVKEALLHNDLCPEVAKNEIEKAIAIFDLLRELDAPDMSAEEKAEIQEDLKYLFKTLSDRDRAVVKTRAYSLSKTRKGAEAGTAAAPAGKSLGSLAEAPPSPAPAAPPVPAQDPSYSQALLAEELGLEVPTGALPVDPSATGALHAAEEAAHAAVDLSASDELSAADELLASEALAAADARAFEETLAESIPEASAEGMSETDDASESGDEEEGYDLAAWEALLEKEPAPEPEGGVPGQLGVGGADKAELARTTSEDSILGMLAYDPTEEVQLGLIANPALGDRLAGIIAKRASSRVANAIYRERRLFMRPMVQKALLQCPNAPSSALLEVVNSISTLPGLMDLIRSPRVRYLEVKAKARARLSMVFKAMGTSEKMAAIQRSGRWVIKELWSDFFRDDALVLRCIQEKRIDSGTAHEIARSKIAPRKALEAIGNSPEYTSNYQICLDLVLNPKTPRQIVTKLIRKLNPADRKAVKNNPSLPESVRRHA